MTRFVGLVVPQKLTAICVVDETGRRLWRGQCATDPAQIERMVRRHAGQDASVGIETGCSPPHARRGDRLARGSPNAWDEAAAFWAGLMLLHALARL